MYRIVNSNNQEWTGKGFGNGQAKSVHSMDQLSHESGLIASQGNKGNFRVLSANGSLNEAPVTTFDI
jgi:hypothetical protein